MSQPPYQPPQQPYGQQPPRPPTQPMQQMPPGKPPKRKLFGWLPLILASVVALFLGVAIGTGGEDATTAAPAETVTATATKTVEVPAGEEPTTEPTVEPEPEPTEEPAGYTPRKKDFRVKVKILSKQCFGSAGCNVEFKIDPSYVGSQTLPDTGVIEVSYKVTGDESGPQVGTFTIEGGQASYDKEGSMSTRSSSTKVKATVTDVEYDENA